MLEACRKNAAWQAAGLGGLQLAVNVSGRQFRGSGLVESVIQILNRTHIPPELLELEITEQALVGEGGQQSVAGRFGADALGGGVPPDAAKGPDGVDQGQDAGVFFLYFIDFFDDLFVD